MTPPPTNIVRLAGFVMIVRILVSIYHHTPHTLHDVFTFYATYYLLNSVLLTSVHICVFTHVFPLTHLNCHIHFYFLFYLCKTDCQCSLPNGMKNCKNMPAKMEIDFMRLYQDPEDSTHTLGCSPKGFPTAGAKQNENLCHISCHIFPCIP